MSREVTFCAFFMLMFPLMARPKHKSDMEVKQLVKNFQKSVLDKDSVAFMKLFFTDRVMMTGVMSAETENSIRKKNPIFQGISISPCTGFISSVLHSEKREEERICNIKTYISGRTGSVSFLYSYQSGNDTIQWGEEYWNIAFADGTWLITDIVYSIHYPKIEPVPKVLKSK